MNHCDLNIFQNFASIFIFLMHTYSNLKSTKIKVIIFFLNYVQIKHDISIYPFYHTGYETFYMVSTFVDPDFKLHQGCGRVALLTLKFLSDSMIIPYSIEKLPKIMLNNLKSSKNREKWAQIYDKYCKYIQTLHQFYSIEICNLYIEE